MEKVALINYPPCAHSVREKITILRNGEPNARLREAVTQPTDHAPEQNEKPRTIAKPGQLRAAAVSEV